MEEGEHTINAKQFPEIPNHVEISDFNTIYDGSNFIHPTAIISSGVELGKGNFIGAYCIIRGKTKIGDNNKFHSFCSVGSEPEHKEHWHNTDNKGTIIGNNCMFREFITINAGCENPTIIEDDVIMLRGSHVGHDSKIMRNATISCNVLIGGHSLIGIFANMGLGSVCHQYSRIPHYCMIGMNSTLTKKFTKDANAFQKYAGTPAKHLGMNAYWAQHFTQDDIRRIIEEFEKETLI